MDLKLNIDIRTAANRLAEHNVQDEPNVKEIYLFPCEDEIRLIELDTTALPDKEGIYPFYFRADPQGGIPFPCAIALIQPDDKSKLTPPQEWGTWDDSVRIWPKEK